MVVSAGVRENDPGTQLFRACSLEEADTFRAGMGREHDR